MARRVVNDGFLRIQLYTFFSNVMIIIDNIMMTISPYSIPNQILNEDDNMNDLFLDSFVNLFQEILSSDVYQIIVYYFTEKLLFTDSFS